MKILLLQREQLFVDHFLRAAKKRGDLCEVARTYSEAYKKINNYEYDFVIIDLNILGGNLLELSQQICQEMPETGLMIIATHSMPDERITFLNAGADDFLNKPIHLPELFARIKAIRRRKANQAANELVFDELIINLDGRRVIVNDVVLQLTKKEYDILVHLAQNKNRIITKERLAEYLWGDHTEDADSYDFIYAHVKNLRKKLIAQNCGEYLKNVYGVGYKFEV